MTLESPPYEALTEREQDILASLVQGLSNQEIANKHHLALKTIKWYNSRIYSKLGASNRDEAIRIAEQHALAAVPAHHDAPNNLPSQMTPFVGRQAELAELTRLLQDTEVRLITILGHGGMGKTRLSLAIAERSLSAFEHGVFFLPLAQVNQADDIAYAMTEAFSLHQYAEEHTSLEAGIHQFFRSQHMLLVLDNFEHLLDGVSFLTTLLQVAPHIKCIVTSRERLQIRGEHIFVLRGLDVPVAMLDKTHNSTLDESPIAIQSDAMRLFLQATQRVVPAYVLTQDDLPHVARICQLVGGMPLALELAAGWMDTLTAERIADEITRCLDVLETDMRDVPERHRSIRAALTQTWEQLSSTEQRIMMGASLFEGGFSQDAAEHVLQASLRDLRRLVNKALIDHRQPQGRYGIHDLVRQFCREQLQQSEHYDDQLERYLTYFVKRLQASQITNFNYDHATVFTLLEDRKNIIATWDNLLLQQRFDTIMTLSPVVDVVLSLYSDGIEHIHVLERARDAIQDAMQDAIQDVRHQPTSSEQQVAHLQQIAHHIESYIACLRAKFIPVDEARELMYETIKKLQAYGDSENLVRLHWTLAENIFRQIPVEYDKALKTLQTSLEIAQRLDDARVQFPIFYSLIGLLLKMQKRQQAQTYIDMMDASIPEHANAPAMLWVTLTRGHIAFYDKDYAATASYWQSYLDDVVAFQVVYEVSKLQGLLAEVYLVQGEIQAAKEQVLATIKLHKEHAQDWQMIGTLWGIVARIYLMGVGDYAYAALLCAFVNHHPISPSYYIGQTQQLLEQIRPHLQPDVFEQMVEHGKHLKLKPVVEDLVAYLSAEN
jgi:predicted ATPase/DNA-binding CsgD family transcriptional regulator